MQTLIHIGYHKTASTWLQKHLLDNSEAGFKRFLTKACLRDELVTVNPLKFNATELRARYESLLDDSAKVSAISSERLSGNPHSGGYDSKEIADRLKETFPEAKVLIVIREQAAAIESCYLQYVKFGGACSLEDYLNPSHRNLPTIPLFDFAHFNYLRLIKYYTELFGRDNVSILDYAMFKNDPKDFCNRVCDFAGADKLESLPYSKVTNRRLSNFSSNLLRQINKVCIKTRLNPSAADFTFMQETIAKAFLFIDDLLPHTLHEDYDRRQKEFVKAAIANRYQEANRELAEITALDLEAFGYQL